MTECGAVAVRESFLKAFVDSLNKLKVLTVGLTKIASEEAAQRVLKDLTIPVQKNLSESLTHIMTAFGAEVRDITLTEEAIEVKVRQPCPFSLTDCVQFCPLPHISTVHLSMIDGRWYPRKQGRFFVEKTDDSCRFTLVRAHVDLENS
ncbi:MAG: hypothetical protein NZ954_02190 [Thermofilaceae archaeon]|nr:hypothetical protein [Thermofilaceae archaeon]MCX8180918.1 hypothetical protein [Thermofilaceae archaeon]MDW8003483.1 hypothetical protein [Thermofilaceae archaeon]